MTRRVTNMNLTQLLADLNVKDQVPAMQSLSSARNPYQHWKNGWDCCTGKVAALMPVSEHDSCSGMMMAAPVDKTLLDHVTVHDDARHAFAT